MAYLHCWIWIPILIPIWTANQMATLYYVWSQCQIASLTAKYGNEGEIGIGMESESVICECK